MSEPKRTNWFEPASIRLTETDSKIGVLCTTDEAGYPHLSFISSLQAIDDTHICWGQFSAGLSKRFIKERRDVGFLVLNADMRFLSGTARYTHTENTGALFDLYNNKPLFRYNTYFGFSRVYCMDLVETVAIQTLPMPSIVLGAICTRIKAAFVARSKKHALPRIAKRLFAEMDSLKFIAYSNDDGALSIIPIIQAGPAGGDRIAFSRMPYGKALREIPNDAKVAVLCVNLKMESVLVKGIHRDGVVEIERVYNSMPPKMEYVFPRSERIEAVTTF